MLHVYCDGSSIFKDGSWQGGWGVVFLPFKKRKNIVLLHGACPGTNNQMEVLAAIKALEHSEGDITIHSDSDYLVKGMNVWLPGWISKRWKKVKNPEWWKRLLTQVKGRKVIFQWVKGHNGNQYNEMADEIAKSALNDV